MTARQVTQKSALVEARWVIKIMLGIIGVLLTLAFLIGWVSESNETDRMTACVSKSDREWVNGECVFPKPAPSSS